MFRVQVHFVDKKVVNGRQIPIKRKLQAFGCQYRVRELKPKIILAVVYSGAVIAFNRFSSFLRPKIIALYSKDKTAQALR